VLLSFLAVLTATAGCSKDKPDTATSDTASRQDPSPVPEPQVKLTYKGMRIDNTPAVVVESIGWCAGTFDYDESLHGGQWSPQRKALNSRLYWLSGNVTHCWDARGRPIPNRNRAYPYDRIGPRFAEPGKPQATLFAVFSAPSGARIHGMELFHEGKEFPNSVGWSSGNWLATMASWSDVVKPVGELPAAFDARVAFTVDDWLGPAEYAGDGGKLDSVQPPAVLGIEVAKRKLPPGHPASALSRRQSQVQVFLESPERTEWCYDVEVFGEHGTLMRSGGWRSEEGLIWIIEAEPELVKKVSIGWCRQYQMEIEGISLRGLREMKNRQTEIPYPPATTRKVLGPERKVTLGFFEPGAACLLDLESGTIHQAPPVEEEERDLSDFRNWLLLEPVLRNVGLDLTIVDYGSEHGMLPEGYGLFCTELAGPWEDVNPNAILRALREARRADRGFEPRLQAFRTRDGSYGVMEFRRVDYPHPVELRYRLLVPPGPQSP
jgi:hypothetical protein